MTVADRDEARLRVAFLVLVGIARIALGAHYPTDVLAGLLCGLGALAIYAWLTRPGSWADTPPAKPKRTSAGSS